MSKFEVKLKKVRGIISGEAELSDQINGIQDDVERVCNNLGFKIASANNIRGRLRRIADDIDKERQSAKNLERGLAAVVDLYEKTERRICDDAEDGEISFSEVQNSILNNITESGGAIIRNAPLTIGPAAGLIDLLITGKIEIDRKKSGEISDYLPDGVLKDLTEGKFRDKFIKKDWDKQGYWDKDGYHRVDQKKEIEKDNFESEQLDKAATLYNVGIKKEKSHWESDDDKWSVDGKYGEASAKAKIGNREVHADAYAGLYAVGPNGEKIFAPGVGGEIGASVTAFSAEGMAMLGDDNLGVYVHGDVTAGKVGVKAGVDIGLVDENGKINPQANISAEAEAILIEGTAAIGGKILGTDVSGNVGVNVGIGAHADVGIKDGKISIDVGASLGVGVSVNLEIDVSGTIDKAASVISDVTSSIWNMASGWFG